ncbi:MAG: TolC family protein, partial [Myxococcales bacterium]
MIALLLLAQALPPVRPVEPPAQSSIRAPLPDPVPEAAPEGPVLPLAEALQAARDQSPDLAVALERVTQAHNDVLRAWATLKPTLTATGSYTYNSVGALQFTNGAISEGKKDAEAGSLVFNWNLFNLRALPTIQSAYQKVDVARLTETQQRRELLLSVASTYYSGLALREL